MTEPIPANDVKREGASAPGSPPRPTRRLSELSAPRQTLVRLCQSVNFGQIRGLEVRDSDPVFSPPPEVLFEVKLDSDVVSRPEIDLEDFVLPAEFCRLMERLDNLKTATIEQVEVRGGVARRVIFKSPMTGPPR
jgi:hypothetical protein